MLKFKNKKHESIKLVEVKSSIYQEQKKNDKYDIKTRKLQYL